MKITCKELEKHMEAGERWRPSSWKNFELFDEGHCRIQDSTFIQYTPKTFGIQISPAIEGIEEAVAKFGDDWECISIRH